MTSCREILSVVGIEKKNCCGLKLQRKEGLGLRALEGLGPKLRRMNRESRGDFKRKDSVLNVYICYEALKISLPISGRPLVSGGLWGKR